MPTTSGKLVHMLYMTTKENIIYDTYTRILQWRYILYILTKETKLEWRAYLQKHICWKSLIHFMHDMDKVIFLHSGMSQSVFFCFFFKCWLLKNNTRTKFDSAGKNRLFFHFLAKFLSNAIHSLTQQTVYIVFLTIVYQEKANTAQSCTLSTIMKLLSQDKNITAFILGI